MHTRRGFLAGAAASAAAASRQPNIIVVLADDLGWGELGCYGNTFNSTPNLDRLAREGVRFTHAYSASPVCSPMRASYMTGQYPMRVGINDYLRDGDPKFLSPRIETLPKQFAKAGYRTGLIGKWHLMGDYKQRKGDPKLHGFHEVICSESSYIGPGYYWPPYRHMKEVQPRREGEYLTDRMNQEAVEFIERNAAKPFLLCLNHYAPHTKLSGKPDKVESYRQKTDAGKKSNNPALAAMLESIDEGIGAILSKLDALNLTANTMVIFTSDNGGETTVTTNGHLHGGKSQLYEGGIRVPLIVRWPGRAKEGAACGEPVCSIDFYPTLLQAAGISAPNNHAVDGAPLVPLLANPSKRVRRESLYWYYPLDKPHFLGGRSAAAIRKGAFKLIEFLDKGEVELYNLEADDGESKNLASAMPEKAAELRRDLDAWRRQRI
ncbi:MAG: sulfatase [Bryobacteraceae bacterium]